LESFGELGKRWRKSWGVKGGLKERTEHLCSDGSGYPKKGEEVGVRDKKEKEEEKRIPDRVEKKKRGIGDKPFLRTQLGKGLRHSFYSLGVFSKKRKKLKRSPRDFPSR